MQDYRSSPAESCRDSRDLLEVVLQKKEEHRSDTGSRISALLARTNGNLSRPSSFSRRSLNLSRHSLNSDSRATLLDVREGKVVQIIYSLALLCLASLLLAGLSLQILFSLGTGDPPLPDPQALAPGGVLASTLEEGLSLLNGTKAVQTVAEVAAALSTLVIMLDLCCLMVCSMQCFFASKILNTQEGEERAMKYLRECSSSRFIAVLGFFLSIPSFMLAVMTVVLLRLRSTSAVAGCVLLGVGLLLCVLSVMQNAYHWRVEKTRADEGLPVYDTVPGRGRNPNTTVPRNELSTLV